MVWACWWDNWHDRIESIEAATELEARRIAARRKSWPVREIIVRYRKTISRGNTNADHFRAFGPQDGGRREPAAL